MATNTTIDTLEVKISANAQTAVNSLKSLASALRSVKTALTGVDKDGLKASDHIAKSLNEMNGALNTITTSGIKRLQKLANGLNDYADALKRVKAVGSTAGIAKGIKSLGDGVDVSQQIKETKEAVGLPTKEDVAPMTGGSGKVKYTPEDLKKMGVFTHSAAKGVETLKKEVKDAGQKAKSASGFFGKFVKSIGRIMLYRAIRSALKAIAEAFDEGLKNAYGFSQQSESFKRLAETMDRIKTITSQMINQIGAFWGEVKQFVLPAVEWLVEKVRWVAERLTELFAALNGETTYLQAKLVAQTWGEATDNVKKYKQQLLGLDELNNLTSEKKSGKEETDYLTLYDIVDVNKKLFDSVSKIRGMINELTIGIGDILFDWDDLTGEDIAKKIIAGIGGLLGMVMGFSFGGVPGAIVGTIAGVTLGAIIAELSFDNGDTTYDKGKLRSILYPVLGAIVGAWIGFKASGLTGALVGMTVGATMGFVLSRLSFSQKDGLTYGKGTLREKLFPVLGAIAGAWIGFKISGMTGMLVGMSVGATLGMILANLTFGKDSGLSFSKDRLANQLIASALVGIAGAFIGFKVSGVTGALVGMSIGATLGMTLGTLFFDQSVGTLTKERLANQIIASTLVGIMGGLIGFAVGGTTGALIGMSIGVTLTMLIKDVEWKTDDGKPDIFGIPSELLPNGEAGRISPDSIGIIYGEPVKKEMASGGAVQRGSYFLAGEAGPEFVGSIGSTSAVANTEQMTEAIRKAAYMGVSQALKENGGMNGFEPATTDDLFIAMKKKSSAYTKRTGQPAFG